MLVLSNIPKPDAWHRFVLRQSAICWRHDILHEGRDVAHLVYFATIAFAEHGPISAAGGVLFVLGFFAMIFHEGEP